MVHYAPPTLGMMPLELESPSYVNGQRVSYTADGMAISEQEAMNRINSGWIGGMIGLSQILSRQIESVNVRTITFNISWGDSGGSSGDVITVNTNAASVSVSFITGITYADVSIPIITWAPQINRGVLRIADYYDITKTKDGAQMRFKDKDSFQKLFDKVLNSGSCKSKLDELLKEIGKLSGSGQGLRSHSIEKLFELINAQKRGGIFIDQSSEDAFEQYKAANGLSDEVARRLWPAGGGGVHFRNGNNPSETYIYIFPRDGWFSYTPRISRLQQSNAYQDFARTIHELFHAAGQTRGFSHEQMDHAAKNLGASGFTAYVEKYCVPEEYGSGLIR